MGKKRTLLIALMLAMLVFTGCSMEDDSKATGTIHPRDTVFTSTGGEFQITATPEWQDLTGELHPEAELEIGSLAKDKYLILIPELKIDLNMSFEAYTKIVLQVTAANLENKSTNDPVSLTIGGFPAYLSKVSGNIDGVSVFYWVYTIDCPDHYVQIIAWTLKSRKESYEANIAEVASTFGLAPQLPKAPEEPEDPFLPEAQNDALLTTLP